MTSKRFKDYGESPYEARAVLCHVTRVTIPVYRTKPRGPVRVPGTGTYGSLVPGRFVHARVPREANLLTCSRISRAESIRRMRTYVQKSACVACTGASIIYLRPSIQFLKLWIFLGQISNPTEHEESCSLLLPPPYLCTSLRRRGHQERSHLAHRKELERGSRVKST